MKRIKELFALWLVANLIVMSFVACLKLYNTNNISGSLYYIRTIDGNFYSNKFRHYGNHVTFLYQGEMVKKSQKGLHGTVVERIR